MSGLIAMKRFLGACLSLVAQDPVELLAAQSVEALAGDGRDAVRRDCFKIAVVDEATGRGVPMVELCTVHDVLFVTDSAGVAAILDPELLGREVYFHVQSHGYEYPKDGFGFSGATLTVVKGGSAQLSIRRINVAERLYRMTGAGIYRDSILLGEKAPIKEPLINGLVTGQDSALAALYHGRLFWCFGDTNRFGYPLGNFAVSCAVSSLQDSGGLPPSVGVDLEYFVDVSGFSRRMCPIEGQPGPVWLDALMVLQDAEGKERLVARFMRVKTLGELYEQGMAVYDDESQVFEPTSSIPLDAPVVPKGHPLRVRSGSQDYFYFADPFGLVRVRADWSSVLRVESYESFTCLRQGERYQALDPALERDAEGRLVYGWKKHTAVIGPKEQKELVRGGHAKAEELWLNLRDATSGKAVQAHAGSCSFNSYRGRYVLIAVEVMGDSYLGEVWYAEADSPEGPWSDAVRIVTHDDYSFYNPAQRPWFAEEGGRFIYFDGTYSKTFSGTKVGTPRYDYNQITYRLDLSDPRLAAAQSRDQNGDR